MSQCHLVIISSVLNNLGEALQQARQPCPYKPTGPTTSYAAHQDHPLPMQRIHNNKRRSAPTAQLTLRMATHNVQGLTRQKAVSLARGWRRVRLDVLLQETWMNNDSENNLGDA